MEETIWVDASPIISGTPIKLILDSDRNDGGIKEMSGDFPALWTEKGISVFGPLMYDDNFIYKVFQIDYAKKKLWLTRI